jgi:hypothetical protein
MKTKTTLAVAAAVVAGVIAYRAGASGRADEGSAPVYLTEIPAGYRDWS